MLIAHCLYYIYQKVVKNSVNFEEKFFNNRYLDDYVEVIINKKIALGAILGGNIFKYNLSSLLLILLFLSTDLFVGQ